jgi:hypothetical protein
MRKPTAVITIFTVAFAVALSMCSSGFAQTIAPGPTDKIFIRSDGSVEPSNAPIQREGSVYYLTCDINFTSIEVSCSGIILDGNGFFDRGYVMRDKAVILRNCIGSTVKNFNFEKFSTQIDVESGLNNVIVGNTFTGACYGVEIYSSHCQILANKFVSNQPGRWYGIEGKCDSTLIANNIFENFGTSIQLTHSEQNMIFSNSFADATSIMFYQGCNNNTISQNSISGIGLSGTGVYLIGSGNNLITQNTICDKAKNYKPTFVNCFGVWMYESSNNQVYYNNISGNIVGIQIGTNLFPEKNPSINNIVYQNNLFNNMESNAEVGRAICGVYPANSWDNGVQGNYWSDYQKYPNATQIDNSATGNIPYNVTVSNIDFHPLLKPFMMPNQTITQSITTPTPTPTYSPEPSATPLPSTEAVNPINATPNQQSALSTSNETSTFQYVALGTISAVAISVGAFAYFKRGFRTI